MSHIGRNVRARERQDHGRNCGSQHQDWAGWNFGAGSTRERQQDSLANPSPQFGNLVDAAMTVAPSRRKVRALGERLARGWPK